MSAFIAPEHFDCIVQATRNLCSYDPNPENEPASNVQRPSLALRLGHAIKKAAMILRGIALRQKDAELKQNVDMFLELLDAEWSIKKNFLFYINEC